MRKAQLLWMGIKLLFETTFKKKCRKCERQEKCLSDVKEALWKLLSMR